MIFKTPEESHAHSLRTLDALYEYDDFMMSIATMADIGCGQGLDLEWWATRTFRDESNEPLNIKCTGIDIASACPITKNYRNTQFLSQDFEDPLRTHKTKFDVVWSHDAFQYAVNPLNTLSNWWHAISDGGMLAIVVPQTTNMEFNLQAFDQPDGHYSNWTMVSLIHALAVSGFDCDAGFFLKEPGEPWLHAVVYKSDHAPMDPKTTRWYDLADRGLLPASAVASVTKFGYLRQRDLVLPWINKALRSMSQE
jgi:SAM-dependent methyltransferase